MSEQQFNKACAERVITTIGLNVNDVRVCMGNADDDHPLLDNEKMAQMGDTEGRGDVTINPTVIINQRHYRGKLDTGAVLKAICAGFDKGLEPDLCNNPSVMILSSVLGSLNAHSYDPKNPSVIEPILYDLV
jgi:hypothetical protein